MAVIATFGDIVFEVTTDKLMTFTDLSRSTEPRYVEHAVQLLKPRLEFEGQGLDPVKLTVLLRSNFGLIPVEVMAKFRKYAQQGRKERFILGDRPISSHKFVIKRCEETNRRISNKGFILEIEAQLELLEYVEDVIEDSKPTTSSVKPKQSNPKVMGTMKITVKSVHIRSGPGVNNKVLGYAMKGDKLTVLGIENGWYKLGGGRYITANSAYSKLERA